MMQSDNLKAHRVSGRITSSCVKRFEVGNFLFGWQRKFLWIFTFWTALAAFVADLEQRLKEGLKILVDAMKLRS